jgi:two-component system, OmpR family, response regulator MprA
MTEPATTEPPTAVILVADDDDDILSFVVPELRAEGYEVRTARDGVQALRMLVRRTFDLAILDVSMPGLEGPGVARILKAKGVTAPVMFVSARVRPADRALGLEAGAVDYVIKPFETAELLARVRLHLRAHRGAAADAAH